MTAHTTTTTYYRCDVPEHADLEAEVKRLRDGIRSVLDEAERQHVKWGEQNHPDGTGGTTAMHVAEDAKAACARNFAAGEGTWSDILMEEVCEAVAEEDPERLRVELVQVAAVAVSWIEAIDRRTSR